MPTHIRINTQHLSRDHARSALILARQATKTAARPTLSEANASGFYYAVIDDDKQLRVFVGFLMTASIKYEDRTGSLPQGAVRPKSSTAGKPSKPVSDVVGDLLDALSPLFKKK